MLPGGTVAYADTDSNGNWQFITPDDGDWLRMFPEVDAAQPTPAQRESDDVPPQPMASVNTVDISNMTHDTGITIRHWTLTPGAGLGVKKPAPGCILWDPLLHTGVWQTNVQIPIGSSSQPMPPRYFAMAANLNNQGFGAHMPTLTRLSNTTRTRGSGGRFFPNTVSGSGTPYAQAPGRPYPSRGGGGNNPSSSRGGGPENVPPTCSSSAPGMIPPLYPLGGSGRRSKPPPRGGYALALVPPARHLKWVYKPDLSAYTDLKVPKQFSPWVEDTFFTMVAQGLGNIAEATYVSHPTDQDKVEKLQQQQRFTFMMAVE